MDHKEDRKKIIYAILFLKERVLAWFKPYLIDYINIKKFKYYKKEI
jgi:hypothetical protein